MTQELAKALETGPVGPTMARCPTLAHFALGFALVLAPACHARRASEAQRTNEPSPTNTSATTSMSALETRELASRYAHGLGAFDRGDYEIAAALFAQALLDLPQDRASDFMRHLLIQHIAWALLGSYDVGRDLGALDRGEQMLEVYLVKHEALLPHASAEREVIYALLAEFGIRREGGPPPDAHDRLVALVEHTQAGFRSGVVGEAAGHDDRSVRIIEVDTVRWARLDDAQIQAFFRDPRDLGPSLFDKPGEPYNPTRVLVRGHVRGARAESAPGAGKRALRLLRVARPKLERCYEQALGRGAELLEQARLDLAWDAGVLAQVGLDETSLDAEANGCVHEALRHADRAPANDTVIGGASGLASAQLRLTFFVQYQAPGPADPAEEINQFGPFMPSP